MCSRELRRGWGAVKCWGTQGSDVPGHQRHTQAVGSHLEGLPGPRCSPSWVLPLLLGPLALAQVIQEPQQEAGLATGTPGPTWPFYGPLARVLALLGHRCPCSVLCILLFPAPLASGIHQASTWVLPLGNQVFQPGRAPARVLPLAGIRGAPFLLLPFGPLLHLFLPFAWVLTLGEPVSLLDPGL